MNEPRSRLPVWTPADTGADLVYEVLGSLRELDMAAARIDTVEVVRDPAFQHRMGWSEQGG